MSWVPCSRHTTLCMMMFSILRSSARCELCHTCFECPSDTIARPDERKDASGYVCCVGATHPDLEPLQSYICDYIWPLMHVAVHGGSQRRDGARSVSYTWDYARMRDALSGLDSVTQLWKKLKGIMSYLYLAACYLCVPYRSRHICKAVII
jgi:hypothetical protein